MVGIAVIANARLQKTHHKAIAGTAKETPDTVADLSKVEPARRHATLFEGCGKRGGKTLASDISLFHKPPRQGVAQGPVADPGRRGTPVEAIFPILMHAPR